MSLRRFLLVLAALASGGAAACTASPEVVTQQPAQPAQPAQPDDDGSGSEDPSPTPDACGAVKVKSKCKPANEGSIVRGVVKFDASKLKTVSSTDVKLRIFLHHQMTTRDGEDRLGGHPHAFKSYPVDLSKGEARFSLDLCEFGVAMWSEENCGFHVVAMIDGDGGNDPNNGPTALVPRKGTFVKMVPIDISCHAPSPCLEITADCVDGEACTTYSPPAACSCAPNSCPSDDSLCKG